MEGGHGGNRLPISQGTKVPGCEINAQKFAANNPSMAQKTTLLTEHREE